MRRYSRAAVEPVRQRTQFSCVAASLSMCLRALGVSCNEDAVAEVMGLHPLRGATWEDVIAAAQHFGCRATLVCPSTWQQLKEWVGSGDPVIVSWNPEGREWSHASVVYDITEDHVVIADPNIPDPDKTTRVVSKDEFYSKWSEKWPKYMVRRPAVRISREITEDGRQVMASSKSVSVRDMEKELARSRRKVASKPEVEKRKRLTARDKVSSAVVSGRVLSASLTCLSGKQADVLASAINRAKTAEERTNVMHIAAEMLGGVTVVTMPSEYGKRHASYVLMHSPEDRTLFHDSKDGHFYVASYNDWSAYCRASGKSMKASEWED